MKRIYVAVMMAIIGRGLAVASRVDPYIRRELERLPPGVTIALRVYPGGPDCFWRMTEKGLRYLGRRCNRAGEIEFIFKHLQHAWLLFSFQENTPTAFARNRILLNGEVAQAAVVNRCLARLQILILPRPIARLAVKRYPSIGLGAKLRAASAIYLRLPLERARPNA